MAKFKIGQRVQIDNPLNANYGLTGKIDDDYRSGAEPQAYGVRWGNGEYFWIRETDLKRDRQASKIIKDKPE